MKLRVALFALTLALLQACIATQEEPVPVPAELVPSYVPAEGLTGKERFLEALSLLENGEPEAARAELVLYREQQPRSAVAKDLLAQIDLPASSYFPEEYREITLEPGLSLSGVSLRYLGSVYKFYALAKYNDILEPRKLTVGQPIKIPLTPKAIAAFEAPEQATQEDVSELVEDTADEVTLFEVLEPEESADVEAFELEAAPDTAEEEAARAAAAVASQVQKLHRQALDAYRAQDLDKSIALWTEALELDPDYESARLYRSQAVALKKRLSNLN